MLNPRDASRPPALPSKQVRDPDKQRSAGWVPPTRGPLQSGMLQNRKLDLHKPKGRATRRP